MHTYLNLKDSVSNVLGRTDGSTAVAIRDNSINFVRQNEIANHYPFSFLEKQTTLTVTSEVADLPADFNINHDPKDVREVGVGEFNKIEVEDSEKYGSGDRVYWIDWNSSTERWRMNTLYDCSLRVIYYQVPATLTADATYDIIPDLDVVTFLAASRYWLSSERDEDNHDRFKLLGQKALDRLVVTDKRKKIRKTRSVMNGVNMGFNKAG